MTPPSHGDEHAGTAGAALRRLADERAPILQQLSEGVIIAGTDGKLLFVNQAAERLHGVKTLEVAPDEYSKTYHLFTMDGEVYPVEALPLARAVMKGETVEDARWRIRRPDGSEIVAIGSARPLIEAGRQVGAILNLRDDSERFEAERRLRESEAQVRLVLDSAAGAFYSVDREGYTTLVSRGFLELIGFADESEALGRKLHDVIHHTHPDGSYYPVEDCPIYRCALTPNPAHVPEDLFYRLDGTPVPVEYWVAPIMRGGKHVGATCTILDLTERMAAEAIVRESEARFRNLANQSPMMVWVTDPEGSCTFLSQSWYEFTGQREEEALGCGWLDAVHPDDREMSGKAFVESNAAQTNFKIECRLRGADGNYRWAIDAATPLFGPDGDYLGYVGSVVDIDEQKKVEQSLAERVAQEFERRSQAEQALLQSQKIETLGQLTGGVAHDFNNLLTPIVGALDVAKKSLENEPRALRLVSGAIQAADRARILVQRLLAFSRRQHLQPRAVDIAALVNGVSDLIHRSIGPQITLKVDIDPDLPPARVDPNQLELALINLAVNARDAMPDGGTLTITARAEDLADHDRLGDGQFICIAVADNGTGMTQAVINRAIEPFFTTKDIGEGTGLGLSSVQGLALQSGGELHLRSKVGHGTTATLWLPVSDQQPVSADQTPATATTVHPTNLTALLVDDEPLVRAGIAAMLDDLGYGVVEASSAAEATVLAESGVDFDLLITDHAMPGRTGTELAKDMRLRRPDLPVLLVTGYAKVAEDGSSGLDRLPKPFRQEDLAERLERLLAGTA